MKHFKNVVITIFTAAALLLFVISLYAASNGETINVFLDRQLSILYNSKKQTMHDINGEQVFPILYDGTTYLPTRALCDLLRIHIEWDEVNHAVIITDTQAESVNDMQYLKMAAEYALTQIPVIEEQQKYLFGKVNAKEVNETQVGFLYARVNNFEYAVTYRGYKIFHYAVDYLPNDAALVIPAAGEWEITDDGWYADKRPLYLIFNDIDNLKIVGEFICEFTPQGNSKQFYMDFDSWLEKTIANK